MQQYRQGDVFLVRVDEVPAGAKQQKQQKHIVLAEGEATGHAHVLEHGRLFITDEEVQRQFVEIVGGTPHEVPIYERGAPTGELNESGDPMHYQVRVGTRIIMGVPLIHEEHSPVIVPPGIYEVRRQREYSPEAIRNVAD